VNAAQRSTDKRRCTLRRAVTEFIGSICVYTYAADTLDATSFANKALKENIMKSILYGFAAALILAASLSGCGTAPQESAMQWMQRQPLVTDP
jgi:hypothetical protein